MDLEAIFEAIDAVDWDSFPSRRSDIGRTGALLRALAGASTLNRAADAMTALLDSALTDDLEGEIFPAAVEAAPILLDIVEHAHRRAGSAALGLLFELLERPPDPSTARVGAPGASGLRSCCAIADLVRGRRAVLSAHRDSGRRLLYLAAAHWRFEVREVLGTDAQGVGVFGVLTGRSPDRPRRAELLFDRGVLGIPEVEVECRPEDESGESFLLLIGIPEEFVAPGTFVAPWDCHGFEG
ncbi:hypothetical protein AB0C76_33920 [Kitasatospora sp. NPDC048722]|uniref:hypothetical protein n=1 Tax=Kitasatospora sp. NPDC048722 TaxID=3155639 RepID=UPI0033C24B1F